MFNLNKNSIPKIGFVVTLFVLTTACAHQAVAPANNESNAAYSGPTPEPLSDVEGYEQYSDPKPAEKSYLPKKAKAKKKGHKSAFKHKSLKKKISKAPNAPSETSQAAVMGSVEQMQPPAPPAPMPELTAEHSAMLTSVRTESQPVFQSLWEQAEDYLLYVLMALGTVGIVLVASRLERKRVKGRRKIVFN